jgi:hypothetical protein
VDHDEDDHDDDHYFRYSSDDVSWLSATSGETEDPGPLLGNGMHEMADVQLIFMAENTVMEPTLTPANTAIVVGISPKMVEIVANAVIQLPKTSAEIVQYSRFRFLYWQYWI